MGNSAADEAAAREDDYGCDTERRNESDARSAWKRLGMDRGLRRRFTPGRRHSGGVAELNPGGDRDHLCGSAAGWSGLSVCLHLCDPERKWMAQGSDRPLVRFLFRGCDLSVGSCGPDTVGAGGSCRHLLDCTWCHRALPCRWTFGGSVAAVDRDHGHPQHRRRRGGGDFPGLVSVLPDDLPRVLARPLRVDVDRQRNWPAIRCARSEADGPKSRRLSGHRLDFERPAQLVARSDAELRKQTVKVEADGAVREKQALPDLAVRHSGSGHLGDLKLLWSKAIGSSRHTATRRWRRSQRP